MCEEACLTIRSLLNDVGVLIRTTTPQDGGAIHVTRITIKLFNIRMVHRDLRNVKIGGPCSAPRQAFEIYASELQTR